MVITRCLQNVNRLRLATVMKNPFPGMNPFLEEHWQDMHMRLTMYSADHLQPRLPGDLVARAEEQVIIGSEGRPTALRPDVKIVEPYSLHEPSPSLPSAGGDIAFAEPLVVMLEPDVHRWIEIVDSAGKLITVIELLSPKNKSEDGQVAYRRRQRTYIAGGVSLVEIDLLRKGERVLSLPPDAIPDWARTPYFVCVYRASEPGQREIYPIALRDRLPALRVPLRASDHDIALELQPLVDQAFERGRYWKLDYHSNLQPPLSSQDAAWVDEVLRKSGLRQ